MKGNLIEARDLVVEHRREAFLGRPASVVRALDGVSLEVARGEVICVVGPSGAGKSTLARALLGFERPVAGVVRWSSSRSDSTTSAQSAAQDSALVDPATLSASAVRALRPRIQPVFQDPAASLDPRWSVNSTLREALKMRADRGVGADRIEDQVGALLASVGLGPEHLARVPHELSGGEKQRVCLARALATEPELLVLDEPVAALDASVQAQILDLLASLRRARGLAYLLVTHDLALVEWMADRVLVLAEGKIVEAGTPAEVLGEPRHAATRELVRSRRALESS